MKNKFLKVIYLGSLLPLILGSITFFYWYYKRIYFAENVEIELMSLFAMFLYFVIGPITLILCFIYVFKQKENWKKIIAPILIIIITSPVVDLFSVVYFSFEQEAFIKLINDSKETEILRIRSDNFERTYFENEENEFIFSFSPVYRYDWTRTISGSCCLYDVNRLLIKLRMGNDSIRTFELPRFSKGDCRTVRLSEIIKNQ